MTFGHGCGILQFFHLLFGEHGSLLTFIALSCNQGSTECAHDTGNIRTGNLTVCDFFQASQNCIIIEGTALHDDVLSKRRSIGYFDNLEQCVFNNRVSKSGGNIVYAGALLLGLFYTGVHKYGTTGSQVNGVLCEQSSLSKILNGKVQGFCKGLDEGTAAGGTGLVQLYVVNRVVFNTDTFHILSADIQNTVYIRIEELSSVVMRNGLNFALIEHERCFDQCLTVSGGAGADNMCFFRKLGEKVFQCFQRNM